MPRERLGFCLDTAHLWGAGYAIGTTEGVDDAARRLFDAQVGLDRAAAGPPQRLALRRWVAGSDRHEHLGAGRIGREGLARFLVHPALRHVAYIIETPGMEEGWDAVNLARARDLAAGRPLAPLPPSAFQTRSARGRGAPPTPMGRRR